VVTDVEGGDWDGIGMEDGDMPVQDKQELDYDEDDDEFDLAKMPLHPKRQESIQSL